MFLRLRHRRRGGIIGIGFGFVIICNTGRYWRESLLRCDMMRCDVEAIFLPPRDIGVHPGMNDSPLSKVKVKMQDGGIIILRRSSHLINRLDLW
ncbi:hypothetical protein DL95DRAFT_388404, partial [Leptodontidium sp. 2 PMI_412]